jgi:hypothetical protein
MDGCADVGRTVKDLPGCSSDSPQETILLVGGAAIGDFARLSAGLVFLLVRLPLPFFVNAIEEIWKGEGECKRLGRRRFGEMVVAEV